MVNIHSCREQLILGWESTREVDEWGKSATYIKRKEGVIPSLFLRKAKSLLYFRAKG